MKLYDPTEEFFDYVFMTEDGEVHNMKQKYYKKELEPCFNIDNVKHEINAQNRHQHIVNIMCKDHIKKLAEDFTADPISVSEAIRRLNAQVKDAD